MPWLWTLSPSEELTELKLSTSRPSLACGADPSTFSGTSLMVSIRLRPPGRMFGALLAFAELPALRNNIGLGKLIIFTSWSAFSG